MRRVGQRRRRRARPSAAPERLGLVAPRAGVAHHHLEHHARPSGPATNGPKAGAEGQLDVGARPGTRRRPVTSPRARTRCAGCGGRGGARSSRGRTGRTGTGTAGRPRTRTTSPTRRLGAVGVALRLDRLPRDVGVVEVAEDGRRSASSLLGSVGSGWSDSGRTRSAVSGRWSSRSTSRRRRRRRCRPSPGERQRAGRCDAGAAVRRRVIDTGEQRPDLVRRDHPTVDDHRVGQVERPGMCPATESIGSVSPRNAPLPVRRRAGRPCPRWAAPSASSARTDPGRTVTRRNGGWRKRCRGVRARHAPCRRRGHPRRQSGPAQRPPRPAAGRRSPASTTTTSSPSSMPAGEAPSGARRVLGVGDDPRLPAARRSRLEVDEHRAGDVSPRRRRPGRYHRRATSARRARRRMVAGEGAANRARDQWGDRR